MNKTVAMLVASVCVSVALLAWSGYAAVRGWQRSSLALADRRTEEAAGLLVSALTKDMQGAHRSILSSIETTNALLPPPLDELGPVASAFARYPYAEWFFSANDYSASPVLFARRDRPAAWLAPLTGPNRFPVVAINNSSIGPMLIEHFRRDVSERRRFSVFEITLAGTPYQVVSRLFYHAYPPAETAAVFGFAVNLTWVREHYFSELTRQIGRLAPSTSGVALTIIDDAGREVATTGGTNSAGNEVRRPFPATFFDPFLLTPNAPAHLPLREWTVRAVTSNDPTLAAAARGVTRMLLLGTAAVIALLVGVGLTVRAGINTSRLAELRADFVASVTHELKTPIATIRAAAETLLAGRIPDTASQREYAGMMVQEAKRLGQLIDNLLAFSRVTDTHTVRVLEPIQLDILVADALRRFDLQLRREGFEVSVSVPPSLPPVLGDATALQLALDNVLDNAIRYTRNVRRIDISGRLTAAGVVLDITDRGIGIHPHDVPHVAKKFFRARNASPGGSGLGLAIAERIVADHGGSIAVRSTLDEGTTIVLTLPAASQADARPRVASA